MKTKDPQTIQRQQISEMVSPTAPLARSDARVRYIDLQFGEGPAMHFQFTSAARERLVNMKMPEAYLQLQHNIHDALRAQHPEWIQPNGDCPIGDWYDARLSELLWHDARTRSVIAGRGAGKTSWRIQGGPGRIETELLGAA